MTVVTDKMVEAARSAYSTATGCNDTPHVLDGWIDEALRAALSAALSMEGATVPSLGVANYATRLFDLHGFMLLETYRGKHAVTVTFPDLQQAQQFHNTLVELSQHRAPHASEGSTP